MRFLILLLVLALSRKVHSNIIERNTAVDSEGGKDGIVEFLEEGAKLGLKHRVVRDSMKGKAKEKEDEDDTETPDVDAKSSEKDPKKGDKKGEKNGGMKKMQQRVAEVAKKGAKTFKEVSKDPKKMMDIPEQAQKEMEAFS